jgi:Uma2 family endonuclease
MVMATPSRATDAPPPALRYVREPAPLYFPESELVPESKRHLEQRTAIYQILTSAFRERATIGSEQFVYWDPTDPRQCIAPDAFVRLGVPDQIFPSWKVWERGAPDVAVEIISNDEGRDGPWEQKLERYRRMGVRELVRFDPTREPATLHVWDAYDGDLVERTLGGLVAPSRCLPGAWVVVADPFLGTMLRLSMDQEGKQLLMTAAERVHELEAELARRPLR